MSLKSQLSVQKKLRLPTREHCQLELACKKVQRIIGYVQPSKPTSLDIEQAYTMAVAAWDSASTVRVLPKKVLRILPWAFFSYPKKSEEKIGHQKALLYDYLSWLEGSNDPRGCANLLYVFLRDYPIETASFEVLRQGLLWLFKDTANKRMQGLSARAEQFHFLKEDGPLLFARQIMNLREETPKEQLFDAGLTDVLAVNGFAFQVYLASLQETRISLRNNRNARQHFTQTCRFSLKEEGQFRNENLAYPKAKVELAESLLLPYAGGSATPALKDEIRDILLKLYGDLRIDPFRWNGVDGRAKQVMRHWLVATTLDDFFKVLDKTADTIWTYRKAFWGAYLKKQAIDDAWVVLGRNARYLAKKFLASSDYGKLSGGSSDQSVLLLQIGDLIIAEWSHGGSCRVWDRGATNEYDIPKLYDCNYDAVNLRASAELAARHDSSKTGHWQRSIRDYINNETGLFITNRELMP